MAVKGAGRAPMRLTCDSCFMVPVISFFPLGSLYCFKATTLCGWGSLTVVQLARPLLISFTRYPPRPNSPTLVYKTRPATTSIPRMYFGIGVMNMAYSLGGSFPNCNTKDILFTLTLPPLYPLMTEKEASEVVYIAIN